MKKQNKTIIICDNDAAKLNFYYQCHEVYQFLQNLNKEYPGFRDWYLNRVVSNIMTGSRKIIVVRCNNIIGASMILKNDNQEKKICTLRVHPIYQKRGIGSFLVKKAFEELKTKTPLITVSAARVGEFAPLLNKHGFKLTEIKADLYNRGFDEYIYNSGC